MSVNEIMLELEKMTPEELALVEEKLAQLHAGEMEPTPEMLAAIEEGERSAREEPLIPIEQVIEEMKTWNTKSS